MPCYQTGTARGDQELAADNARKRNTRTTRMLCETLAEFEKYEEFKHLPADVKQWWNKHKIIDSKRKRREELELKSRKIAARAKSKLTRAELRALKLD